MQHFTFLTVDGMMRWARNLDIQYTVLSLTCCVILDKLLDLCFTVLHMYIIMPNPSIFQIVLKITGDQKKGI